MNRTVSLVQQVQIASPCHAKWEEMAGDDRVRFCDSCKLNVYNLSSMSEAEGEELIRTAEGRLCARLYRRADGTVITRDCPVGLRAIRRRMFWVSAKLAAAIGFVLASAAHAMGGHSARERPSGLEMGYAIRPRDTTAFEQTIRTVNRWLADQPVQQPMAMGRLAPAPNICEKAVSDKPPTPDSAEPRP